MKSLLISKGNYRDRSTQSACNSFVYTAGLENDEYVRKTDGYLPTAEVAFIDEIFKANSAILNALLTLLNERLFDNGNERYQVPLLCLVRNYPAAAPNYTRTCAVRRYFDRFKGGG